MRHLTKSAVFLFFTKGKKVLLQKRMNTGFMDGYYDATVSGHIEANESITQAALRETREEIGLEIPSSALNFYTTLHAHMTISIFTSKLISKNFLTLIFITVNPRRLRNSNGFLYLDCQKKSQSLIRWLLKTLKPAIPFLNLVGPSLQRNVPGPITHKR